MKVNFFSKGKSDLHSNKNVLIDDLQISKSPIGPTKNLIVFLVFQHFL